jgi:hypothetical protein
LKSGVTVTLRNGQRVLSDLGQLAESSGTRSDFPQKLIQTNRGIGHTFTCSNAVLKLHPSVASASARSAAASTASSTQSSAKEGVVGSERQ